MSFVPNTTPTPNWLYNGEMRKMTDTELRVVLLITRKTLGYVVDSTTKRRKEQDWISQKQFMEFTGRSHTAIASAIQNSINKGWVIARDKKGNLCDSPEKRQRRRIYYQLGNIFTNKLSRQNSGLDEISRQHSEKSRQHNDTNLGKIVDNTKEILTKENKQKRKNNFFTDKSILEESERIRRLVQ